MNHKRKKRKNIRAGCLACKPHKVNGNNERAKAKEETEALIDEQSDVLDGEQNDSDSDECGETVDE